MSQVTKWGEKITNFIWQFFLRNKIEGLILLAVLLIGAILRFAGIFPGYPYYQTDEGMSYGSAVYMLKDNTLDPGRYDYLGLVALINFLVFKFFIIPLHWVIIFLSHPSYIFKLPLPKDIYDRFFQLVILGSQNINTIYWSRYITAVFGLGLVLLIFLMGRKLFNPVAGLIASALVAVNYREVLNSHFGLPDIYNGFFLSLSFLANLYLLDRPTFKRYLLCSVAAALAFSIKFQVFALIPFFLVHLYLASSKIKLVDRIKHFFNPKIIVVTTGVFILTVIIISPYHVLKIHQTIDTFYYILGKYDTGKSFLDFYSLTYLFHIGIGQLTSFLVIGGIIIGLWKSFTKMILLLSVVAPFLWVFIYYSDGGFFTRNFVTIIPFVLLFAGYCLSELVHTKFKKLTYTLFLVLLLLALRENFANSLIVVKDYSKPWNITLLNIWLSENIPPHSSIAAYSSTPIPPTSEKADFSLQNNDSENEFEKEGADYAVVSTDYIKDDFYWWMQKHPDEAIHYWDMPIAIEEQMHTALAIKELSAYSVYAIFKDWQAPESNFMVVKLPQYSISDLKLEKEYLLNIDSKEWIKGGQLWFGGNYSDNNLAVTTDGIAIKRGLTKSPILHWKSLPLFIDNWKGILIDCQMKTIADNINAKDGFLYVKFYVDFNDAMKDAHSLGLRLSGRNQANAQWNKLEILAKPPEEAKYAKLFFQTVDPSGVEAYLRTVTVYQANVNLSFGSAHPKQVQLSSDEIFPVSEGGM